MGWLSDNWDKVAAGINPTMLLGTVAEGGMNMIGQKYASDLQGHENDRLRQYNLDMQREFFDKNVRQSQVEFERDAGYNAWAWQLNKDREDQVWAREKEYNADLWAKQNEYNSPRAQMQRLTEAGLNPNLMYGQGTTGIASSPVAAKTSPAAPGGASGGSVRGTAPTGVAVDKAGTFMKGLGNYIAMRGQDLSSQNMAAQNALIKAQVGSQKATTEKIKAETGIIKNDASIIERSGMTSRDPAPYRAAGRFYNRYKDDMDTIGTAKVHELKGYIGGIVAQSLRDAVTGIRSAFGGATRRPVPAKGR